MKIYLTSYDSNRPTLKQVNIPNYSSAKIGIEVVKDGTKLELTEEDVKLTSGEITLSADGVYNGYVTIPVTTGDCGDDILYKVEINKTTVGEGYSDSFKLVINSVNSSVIDAAEGTEIPAATTETLGGVKIGEGINVDSEGTISVAGGNSPTIYTDDDGDETIDLRGKSFKTGDMIVAPTQYGVSTVITDDGTFVNYNNPLKAAIYGAKVGTWMLFFNISDNSAGVVQMDKQS